jgi:hypothetical protein
MYAKALFKQEINGPAEVRKFDRKPTFCHSIVLRFHGATTGLPPQGGGMAAKSSSRCRVTPSALVRNLAMLLQHYSSRFNGFKRRARQLPTRPQAAALTVRVNFDYQYLRASHRTAL